MMGILAAKAKPQKNSMISSYGDKPGEIMVGPQERPQGSLAMQFGNQFNPMTGQMEPFWLDLEKKLRTKYKKKLGRQPTIEEMFDLMQDTLPSGLRGYYPQIGKKRGVLDRNRELIDQGGMHKKNFGLGQPVGIIAQ